jgi:hypothetical protein
MWGLLRMRKIGEELRKNDEESKKSIRKLRKKG